MLWTRFFVQSLLVTSPIILQMLKYLFSSLPCNTKFGWERKNHTFSYCKTPKLVLFCEHEIGKTKINGAVHSKAVVLLLLTFCLLLLPWWESVIVLCFVVRYFMSILVLQSSSLGRESWLLCLICLPGVL